KGTVLDLSNRTSTHVHLNASTLLCNQITSIFILWSTFEEALISWCGEARTTNHFCLSLKDSSSTADLWRQYLRDGYVPDGRGYKYSAFNFLTLFDKGSLEIRCAPAFNNPEKV